MKKSSIKELSLMEIKPYWRNPRKNEKAVDAVMQSIKSYGFNNPLILDKNNVIIAGHTRYKALLRLGIEKVPCIVVDLPEDKAKEYRIADNKTSELAEWDWESLVPELREIGNISDLSIYFPESDLQKLVQETTGSKEFKEVTQEQIDNMNGEMQDKFKNIADRKAEETVTITCPHCMEEFDVTRGVKLKE